MTWSARQPQHAWSFPAPKGHPVWTLSAPRSARLPLRRRWRLTVGRRGRRTGSHRMDRDGPAVLIDATCVVHAETREEAIAKATKGESCRPPAARRIPAGSRGCSLVRARLVFFSKTCISCIRSVVRRMSRVFYEQRNLIALRARRQSLGNRCRIPAFLDGGNHSGGAVMRSGPAADDRLP